MMAGGRFPREISTEQNPNATMDNSQIAILLLIVCVALLIAEVFIPSGGMILITAGVCLAASVWFAWRAWADDPVSWWSYLATIVVVIPGVGAGLLYWFPRTSLGKRILLEAPTPDEVSGYDEEAARLNKLVGSRGETLTLMNPGGLVLVEGERHHCEADGLMIEPKQPVEVVKVSGNRLVVRPLEQDEAAADTPADSALAEDLAQTEEPKDDRPLDFEIPHS